MTTGDKKIDHMLFMCQQLSERKEDQKDLVVDDLFSFAKSKEPEVVEYKPHSFGSYRSASDRLLEWIKAYYNYLYDHNARVSCKKCAMYIRPKDLIQHCLEKHPVELTQAIESQLADVPDNKARGTWYRSEDEISEVEEGSD